MSTFGRLSDKYNYTVTKNKSDHTEINFVIFNTYNKEKIIKTIRDALKDLNKSWEQSI